jgi:hypothetical protein
MKRIVRMGCLGVVAGLFALTGCSTEQSAAGPAPQARCNHGGQIQAVEAFMKTKPAAQPLGWDG